MVATGQEMVREKIFKAREKSGNFTSSQGKCMSLKEVRKKGRFKSTYFFLFPLSLLFSNILNSFVHFTDMNHVVLVYYCSLN